MSHQLPNGPTLTCTLNHGRCLICELIDRDSPRYQRAHRKLFFPDEFPDEPPPAVMTGWVAPVADDHEIVSAHAERRLLIMECDYRGGQVASATCGCNDRRWCGLGKGKWSNEPHAVDYGDCLQCVSTGYSVGSQQ